MPTDTEYPPDVIALAMLQAAADGDWASVARLREMGEDPETFSATNEESLFSEFFAADAPPGTHPPFPGAQYDKQIHHWVKPDTGEATHDHEGKPVTPGSAPHAPKAGAGGETAKPAAVSPPPPDLNKPQPGEVGASTPAPAQAPLPLPGGQAPGSQPSGPGTSFRYPAGYQPPTKESVPNEALPSETRPELNAQHAQAVTEYSQSAYGDINKAYRTGKPASAWHQHIDKQLQEAFAAAKPFEKPITVHRQITVGGGISGWLDKKRLRRDLEQSLKTGKPTTALKGYQSTTTDPAAAGFDRGNVKFTISTRHGLDLKPYSNRPDENELLLNSGGQYTVKGLRHDPDGTMHVELEHHLPGEKS